MNALLGSLLFGSSLVSPPTEHTKEDVGVRLEWEAPSECPDEDAFLGRLADAYGRPLRLDPQAEASIAAKVVRERQRSYRLEIETVVAGQTERRTLEAPTCEAVVDASALVVALALEPFARGGDPTAETDDGESNVVPPPPPASAVRAPAPAVVEPRESVTPSAAPVSSPSERSQRAVSQRLGLFVDAAAGVGLTTTIAGGLVGGLAWQRRRARLEASVRHLFARTTAAEPGVRLALTSGALRGCFVPAWGRFELQTCGGLAVGGLRGEGAGPSVVPEPRTALWFGLLGAVGAGVSIARWAVLRAGAELTVLPALPRFHVHAAAGDRAVHRALPVGASFTLGIEMRFEVTRVTSR
jgi:hypothetical protein